MYKKYFLLCLLIALCSTTLGQNNDSVQTYLINYNKVKFITTDSIYDFTLFTEPSGKFYFVNGFVDHDYEKESYRFYDFENKRKHKEYIYKYKYLESITDTIYSCYPLTKNDNLDEKIIRQTLEISYILKKFGESKMQKTEDTIIKILYPCEEFNFSHCYRLTTLKLSEKNTEMYVMKGCFEDCNDIHILKNDTCVLKNKHVRKINKHINNINSLNTDIFLRNNNAWFMAYHTSTCSKYFIVSNDSFNNENSKAIKLTVYTILGLASRCLD
ncbi:MAG: hypothetical protein PHP31_09860 [Lentimicrobiaceae bacterium]|nr:hypothetical protein [Lentimicrobiaceae bacterium]